jgi:four helix bundle protein
MTNDQAPMTNKAKTVPLDRYLEADEAGSKRKFNYRVSTCRREARETQYWLRMLVSACPDHAENARALWKEARELVLILAAIHRSATAKNR